jgi:hypothetical protein
MELFKLPISFKKPIRENEQIIIVSYSLQVSFFTSGQVRYTDSNGSPKIVEFNGNNWSVELLLKENIVSDFSAFIINPKKIENQILTLTKKVNSEIVSNKSFLISNANFYDGWFKLS